MPAHPIFDRILTNHVRAAELLARDLAGTRRTSVTKFRDGLQVAMDATDDAEMARRIAEANAENAIRQRDEARAEAERLRAEVENLTGLAWGSPAMADVAAERYRQVEREGWSRAHDDTHDQGELALAAGCYALWAGERRDLVRRHDLNGDAVFVPRGWPWHSSWWKPKDRRRDLIRAAALIIAEIERLDRAARAALNTTRND